MKPTLHFSPGSHHSRRVTVVVHELGLDVELRPLRVLPPGMGGENESEAFRTLNPNTKVPVLQDGDLVLWESNAIVGYLCDVHGATPLWPRDPRRRAVVAKWQFWQAAHLSPAADGLMVEAFMKSTSGAPRDDAATASLTTSFRRWCTVLESALSASDYLADGVFTVADIAVATALMYAPMARMPVGDYPHVVAWLARVHARPSWAATEPPPMPVPKKSS
jgi:glutathione S-transferase